ncbi:M56 family metallopeptidase [Agriterribacter sp.]|mgnify:CR=1 FL=1|uniref:M56 family metallopeptidase n=1 Tax=Agriterribacter sp. TaxID=2821509 RepID=UPI002C93EF4E|nr:M56 family metallopeptidase [Agriterribacter sp.]HRP54645.1 M56 family metallopeptidase [Agriterribacter sp.]
MPFIVDFLIKISLGFGITCLFYQLVLRRLTFYTWNRLYLLGYTLFCFFLPFIDITPVLQKNAVESNIAIQFVPALQSIGIADKPLQSVLSSAATVWPAQNWILLFIITGSSILFIRLLIQLISLSAILRKARLISDKDIKLYQVDKQIVPFSFGRSIFINSALHNEKDTEEIIRHEFVHVKQKHSIDILWGELLCVLNWYNPFVWWLRHAIRQNLEFIADNEVLKKGTDKKEYQYLLLKVLGNNRFAVASPFNFYSLKKRIAMMNKIKSTKVHLLKFLFALPLMAVAILSFRSIGNNTAGADTFILAGILFDVATDKPLAGAQIRESNSGVEVKIDAKGYYVLKIPFTNKKEELKLDLICSKNGYEQRDWSMTSSFSSHSKKVSISLIGLVNTRDVERGIRPMLSSSSSNRWQNEKSSSANYLMVMQKFDMYLFGKRIDALIDRSSKAVWIIDGIPYAIGNGSKAWFNKAEVESSPECKVWFDGKIMTIGEANRSINRFDLKGVGAMPGSEAKRILGIDCNVLVLFRDSLPPTLRSANGLPADNKMPVNNVNAVIRKPQINAHSAALDNKKETILIIADSMNWDSRKQELRFKGNVTGNFISPGKDTMKVAASGLYLNIHDTNCILLNGSPVEDAKEYRFNPGQKFRLINVSPAQAVKKYGNKAGKGAVEIQALVM